MPSHRGAYARNRAARRQAGIRAHSGGGTPLGDATDPRWYTDPHTGIGWYGGGVAGVTINPDTALTIGAVYRAVELLAQDVAQLPLILYRRLPDGGKERADDHPLYELLDGTPNEWQTSFEFREQMTASLLLRGRAYAWQVPGRAGYPVALVPLLPARMQVEQLASRRLRYRYRWPEDGRETTFLHDEIMHLRGLSIDGIDGLSPVGLARTTLGLSKAAEEFGARAFGQRPAMSGVLESTGPVNAEQMEATAKSFRDATSGPEAWHSVAVTPPGMKWVSIGMSHEDAQFLQTRQFQVTDVARWFGVPPHMIGDLSRATFSNIEHQSIDYVTHSLGPWLRRWEQVVARDLILDRRTYLAEFLRDALIRGDTLTRYQAHNLATGGRAWKSPDEVRASENLNRLGGDLEEVYEGRGSTQVQPTGGDATARGEEPDDPEPPKSPKRRGDRPVNRLALNGSNGHA